MVILVLPTPDSFLHAAVATDHRRYHQVGSVAEAREEFDGAGELPRPAETPRQDADPRALLQLLRPHEEAI